METKKYVLDTKPKEIFGCTLSPKQQIQFYFLLEPGFRYIIYVLDVAAGIAVVNEHYKAGYVLWGTLSLLLMYFPPFVFFIIIISRPDLWDEQDGIAGTTTWFVYRIVQLIAFPVWVVYRYAKQFFWGVEAIFQIKDEKKREQALQLANQPSQTELYLFLQAFLQSIPQALLQMYIMLVHYHEDKTISSMQVFCIITSLMLAAHKTESFLWFESQRILGKKEPWSPKEPPIQINYWKSQMNKRPKSIWDSEWYEDNRIENIRDNEVKTSTPLLQHTTVLNNNLPEGNNSVNNSINEEIATTNQQPDGIMNPPTYDAPSRSTTNPDEISENSPPTDIPVQSRPDSSQQSEDGGIMNPPTYDAPSRPTTNPDEITHEISENSPLTDIPVQSRPDSSQQSEDGGIMNPPTYDAPSRPTTNPNEITQGISENSPPTDIPVQSRPDSTNIDLPTRKFKLRGMDEDDFLGKSVVFLWWFFFLLSRLLAFAACTIFQPYVALGVLLLHYVIIISHLLNRSRFPSIHKVILQLCLGYVLIFCFIEYRYKIKNVIVFYLAFFILMIVEIIAMTLSWYAYSDLDTFWYQFVVILIFGSWALSQMCMLMHLSILKPNVRKIYR